MCQFENHFWHFESIPLSSQAIRLTENQNRECAVAGRTIFKKINIEINRNMFSSRLLSLGRQLLNTNPFQSNYQKKNSFTHLIEIRKRKLTSLSFITFRFQILLPYRQFVIQHLLPKRKTPLSFSSNLSSMKAFAKMWLQAWIIN